jgi:hypothetical protein
MHLQFPCIRIDGTARGFSSDGLDEDIVTPKLRAIPDKNNSKQNMTGKRYTDLGDSEGLNR